MLRRTGNCVLIASSVSGKASVLCARTRAGVAIKEATPSKAERRVIRDWDKVASDKFTAQYIVHAKIWALVDFFQSEPLEFPVTGRTKAGFSAERCKKPGR